MCVNLCRVVSLCVRGILRVFVCAFLNAAVCRVCICPCVCARVYLSVRVLVPAGVFVRVCAREIDYNLVNASDSAVVSFITESVHVHY